MVTNLNDFWKLDKVHQDHILAAWWSIYRKGRSTEGDILGNESLYVKASADGDNKGSGGLLTDANPNRGVKRMPENNFNEVSKRKIKYNINSTWNESSVLERQQVLFNQQNNIMKGQNDLIQLMYSNKSN